MAEKRFKYKSGWTEGVSVPDGFININGYDPSNDERNYKLLEALNVDWKDIELPWAKSITKWNSWNIDPNNLVEGSDEYNDVIDEAFELDDVKNRLSNRVDWLNQNYDYLKDNGYIDDDGKLEIPGWSKNGKIEKSEDIIDAINYLMWRVIAIDYFTNNWNNRNAERVSSHFIEYDETALSTSLNNLYNSPFPFTFKPTAGDRNSVLLTTTGNKPIAFATTSPGKISIESSINPNIATISIGENGEWNNSYGDISNNNTWYFYKFNAFIKGTSSEYRGPDNSTVGRRGYVDGYKEESFFEFDPKTYELSFTIKQKSGTMDRPNGSQITFEEYSTDAKITITKAVNELQSLSFNGNTYVLSSSANDYGNVYTSTNKQAVPYFKTNIEGVTNEYPINFTLKYGKEYGIYPYFFIKKNGRTVSGTNTYKTEGNSKLFEEYTSSYGSILLKDNQYIYTPPEEPASSTDDSEITICCVFYYPDTDLSRQVTPVFVSFDVILTATVHNKIIFLAPGTNTITQWSIGAKKFALTNVTNNTLWTDIDGIVNNTENNVPYAVRTVTYDEYSNLGGNRITVTGDLFGQGQVSENAILLFDNFVTTYCNSNYDVEFLGVVNQSSVTDREIAIDIDNINSIASSYVKNSITGDSNPYSIYSTIIFGDPIYYSNDKAANYTLAQSVKDSIVANTPNNTLTEISSISVENNLYIEQLSRSLTGQQDTHVYNILRSTAIYPSEDGIIKDKNDETKYVDADNDYYFLAFKISSEEGTDGAGLAYSACKGYYFLRVLRKESSPGFAMAGDTQNEIEYGLGTVVYTMRTQVKQTIYLNRLLTTKSQQELVEFTGKKYWSFYGYGEKENTASAWDSSTIAVKNELTNENYMFIYNEGEKCKVKPYTVPEAKRNNYNFITNPEGGIIVDLNGEEYTVGQFGDESSGAILYIDKFMRAINDVYGVATEYQPIESNSVTIILALALGNTERYVRLRSPQIWPCTIHKREYDIELLETYIQKRLAAYPATNPLIVPIKTDGWATTAQGILNLENMFIVAPHAGLQYIHRLFLGSNELGSGSLADQGENADVIIITMNDSNIPVINVTNIEGYNIESRVLININNSPIDFFENAGTSKNMNFGTTHTDNIEVRYHTYFNQSSLGADFYGNIIVFGFIESQSPNKVELTICTDEYGVYAQKTLTFYVSASAGGSIIEPEIGE